MNRKTLITIHMYLSAFFAPMVLLVAISGGLYLIGIKGSVERMRDEVLEFDQFPSHHHHRCYRDKATSRYILGGRTGTEFIDLATGGDGGVLIVGNSHLYQDQPHHGGDTAPL